MYRFFCGTGAALICVLLLLSSLQFIPVGAQSQSMSDTGRESDVDVKIRDFFDTLVRGNSSSAFDALLRQGPLGSSDAAQASTELRNKVDELQTQLGNILKYEKYDTKWIGEDVLLIRYILKYEHAPVIWTFTLYRKPAMTPSMTNPNTTWMFIQLHFDTDMKILL